MTSQNEKFLSVLSCGIRGVSADCGLELDAAELRSLFDTAHLHGLFPLVFDTLYKHPAVSLLDPAELAAYKRKAVSQAAVQTFAEAEFRRLYAAFEDARLHPVVVKGIVCRSLYPKGDLRRSCDEDLLAPSDRLEDAARIIENFGLQRSGEKAEELAFASKRSPLRIELHGSPFPSDSDAYGHFNEYFKDCFSRAAYDGRSGVFTMCPEDHFFYLVCHALKHFLHSGFGIRQICDIVLFAETYGDAIDWTLTIERCRRLNAELFVAAVLRIGRDRLGFDESRAGLSQDWRSLTDAADPEAMLDDVFAAGVYGSSSEQRLHSSNVTLDAAASAKSGKKRKGSLAASLFPSAKKLSGRYPYLKKAPILLPVAWVCRFAAFVKDGDSVKKGSEALSLGESRARLLERYGITGR